MAWVRSMKKDIDMSVIISRHVLRTKYIGVCDELEYVLGEGGKRRR